MQNDAQPILSEEMKNKMINYLLTKYDRTMRAQIDDQLQISVNFYVQGMSKVNEVDMDYQMTVFFRQVFPIRLLKKLLYCASTIKLSRELRR